MTAARLDEVHDWLTRYVWFPKPEQPDVLALFALHTYTLQAFGVTSYMVVLSAQKQCGKTLLLEVLQDLCRYGEVAADMSAAAVFQSISVNLQNRPTLIFDEVDAIFGRSSEATEGLRGVINSGNRRSGRVKRGSKDGEPRQYETFSAKVLGGIDTGTLPDTVQDRSIPIRLERKLTKERLKRHNAWRLEKDYRALRKRLDDWAKLAEPVLAESPEPKLGDHLSDRQREAWEPLTLIARMAGERWLERARVAALALVGDFGTRPVADGERLLGDIRDQFLTSGASFIVTANLVDSLKRLDEGPWSDYKGDGLTGQRLAGLLRPYGVKPDKVRFGAGTSRGYRVLDFQDVWARYLPDLSDEDANALARMGESPPRLPQSEHLTAESVLF